MITSIIVKLALLLIWIVYSGLEGIREAIFYYYASSSRRKKIIEMHPMFAAQRGLIFATFSALLWVAGYGWLVAVISFFGYAGIFSFIHDGAFFTTYNKLDSTIYKKQWFDYSTTSTSVMDKFLTPVNRTILAVVGLALIITSLFI
jgi:hypothetical protein